MYIPSDMDCGKFIEGFIETPLCPLSTDKISASTLKGIKGASVGQMIIIKSVDSDGVPTSWEAINVGGSRNYVHKQTVPSDTWTIVHNLNCYPSAMVVDTAGSVCVGEIHYDNTNQITISFKGSFGGFAYING